MAFLDIFKTKKNRKGRQSYPFPAGGTTRWSTFGDDIYRLDTARQATNRIITEMSKLEPRHIRTDQDGLINPINSDINRVLHAPNWQMTTSDFLKKQISGLLYYQNFFIYPQWRDNGNGYRTLIALWPIMAQQMEIAEYDDGNLYCDFHYQNGYNVTIAYDEIIHLRLDFASHEFLGGDKYGRPDNDAILDTCRINANILQSVERSAKNAASYKGIVSLNTYASEDELAKSKEDFLSRLEAGNDSWLFVDQKADVAQINSDPKWVDGETLKFLDSKILRNWGVSEAILNGDFTPEQHAAFYQIAIEPIVVSLGQAYSKALFTVSERDHRNEVVFYHNRLQDISDAHKIEIIEKVGGRGAMSNDEIRAMFGMPPIGGEIGSMHMQSLNYIDQRLAKQYQTATSLTAKTNSTDNASDVGGSTDETTSK